MPKANALGISGLYPQNNWDIGATLGRNYEYKAKCIYGFGGSSTSILSFGQFSDFSTPNIGYRAQPVITSLTPIAGTTAGGNTIYIKGQAFWNVTGVQVGGITATIGYQTSKTIYATAPGTTAGTTAGVKNIDVICQHGTVTATNAYTYFAFPTISSVSPTSGPRAGGTAITINGTNFPTPAQLGSGTVTVLIGGVYATSVSVVSSTKITAVTAAGTPGLNGVSVISAFGNVYKPNAFTYT